MGCRLLYLGVFRPLRAMAILSATLLPLLGFSLEATAASLPDVVDKIRDSIVGVGTAYPPRQPNMRGKPSSLRGTGFVVGNGLQVITNAHVIPTKLDAEHNEMLTVFSGSGDRVTAHPARVVRTDESHDLALLEINAPALPVMTLANSESVREGQSVAFSGFPIGAVLGLYPVTHRGMVSAITPIARPADTSRDITAAQLARMRNRFNVFQLDATAYPGNSGSPVYNPRTGRVIGVLNSVFVKESRESILERPSGIAYAIPSSHVIDLMQGL